MGVILTTYKSWDDPPSGPQSVPPGVEKGRGEFKGAAGKKCLGEVRKPEGLRYLDTVR